MGLVVKGKPLIDVSNGGLIFLDNNVELSSRNYGYHSNMHSSTKLMANREGAIIRIKENTRVNDACIHARKYIEIGKNCLIAANVQIIDSNGHDLCMDEPDLRINTEGKILPIIVEDNVWIGMNAIILPGTIIGEG